MTPDPQDRMSDSSRDDTPPLHDDVEAIDAELVAYLDGELDDAATQQMEARLAADARLRMRAEQLKKTYDLLEFLPRTDPSPTFATRTVEKLPAIKSNPEAPPVSALPVQSSVISTGINREATAGSHSQHTGYWLVGIVAAAMLAVAIGFTATAAIQSWMTRPAHESPVAAKSSSTGVDDAPPPDRVIELLPVYIVADHLEFVRALANDPDLFLDEADGPGGTLTVPRVPWASDLPMLSKAYRALPPDRQRQICTLDQQLHQLPLTERTPLLRALEAYAVWLRRLAESERMVIQSAPNARERLDEIRELRRSQWVASLPSTLQKQLKGLPAADRAALLAKWINDENERRKSWMLPGPTREAIRLGKTPWPFDQTELKQQVIDYARQAYRLDDKDKFRLRLSTNEHAWLLEAYELGRDENSWLWFGKLLYDLSGRYEMLPEPEGRPPITDIPQLWDSARLHFAKTMARQRVQRYIGRWPEFALAAHDELSQSKVGPPPADFSFGPARPEEFREPTRQFITQDLLHQIRPMERLGLLALEGRWPEYPRYLIQLSRHYDLSVPGAMLPGRPSDWERTYGSANRIPLRPKG